MKPENPSPARETKFAPVNFKKIDAKGVFEGYASLFGKEDLGHDIIMPGAFRGSLAKRGPKQIKMLFQHDPKEPIG
ncbi:MAG TPA: HK97 family phage prohead protease, partial [Rhizobiales bacterium]|nr:HK97 family phage prohead protease [Hyphomicrobiales bacterium]